MLRAAGMPMTEHTRARLRQVLEAGYQRLQERLGRRLGSTALATEVLHETWIRIGTMGDVGVIRHPEAYLLRMALNVAADRRGDGRRLTAPEIEAARHMMDAVLDPERIAMARAEVGALGAALAELTPRRREILLLARLHDVKHADIANRFGISPRMVEKELLQALRHCARRLDKKLIRRFGPGAGKPSEE